METKLAILRKKAGLSLSELGERCGITKGHLHHLEHGRSIPKISTAYALADALCVTVFDIWPNKFDSK